MSLEYALFQLLLILVVARIFAELVSRVGLPSVLGELLAGVLLGASGLGWVEIGPVITLLAEVGIILLLFDIGLHSNAVELVHVGRQSVVVVLGALLFTLALVFAISFWWFQLPLATALFVGGTLTATSIAITMRILSQLGVQHSIVARIVLGAAVLDDVIGVILLGLLYEFARHGQLHINGVFSLLGFVLVFLLITPLAVNWLSAMLERVEKTTLLPGLVPVAMVTLVIGFALLAELMGVPRIIGGFAAGVALSKNFNRLVKLPAHIHRAFAKKIDRELRPIIQLSTPIFFVTVGLSLDLQAVDWQSGFVLMFSLMLTLVAVIGKLLGGCLLKLAWQQRLMVGAAMVPRGEVSLIYAQLGVAANIFNNEVYAALLATITYLVLLSPFWINRLFKRYSMGLTDFVGPEKN